MPMGKKGAKGMVSQEQKCIWIISQVWPPLFPLSALLVGVGRGPPPYLSVDTASRACPLMAQLEAPGMGGWWRFWNPECLS